MNKIEIIESKWIEGSGYSYTTTLDCIEVGEEENLQDVVNKYALNMVQEQYNADGTTIANDEEDIKLTVKDENGNTAIAWLSNYIEQVTSK